MMIDDEQLQAWLSDAKDGRLAVGSVLQVAYSLADATSAGDPYIKLYIIGLAGLPEDYESLVAEYLSSPNNPMLARIAVKVLCDYWSLMDRYLPEVQRFVDGVPWDTEDDVRQIAISQAGEYLRTKENRPLLESLIRIASDEEEPNRVMRHAAVLALARALGDEYSSLPPASRSFPLTSPWARNVVRRAQAVLGEGR